MNKKFLGKRRLKGHTKTARRRYMRNRNVKLPEEKRNLDNFSIVNNQSSHKLTLIEERVLNKGLSYCITKQQMNTNDIEKDFKRFERTLQLHYFFNRRSEDDEIDTQPVRANLFEKNADWWPPKLKASLTKFCSDIKNNIINASSRKISHNLSKQEAKALWKLRKNKSIIFKKGDKSSGIVIMNRNDYETKITEMLNDKNVYTKTNLNDTEIVKRQADEIMQSLMSHALISEKQYRYLTNFTVRCPLFYGIPKVHKEGIPLRPIVSQTNGPTAMLSRYLSELLMVAEKQIPFILQDTTAFLNIIKENNAVKSNTLLVTLDVTALYTNIPHEQGAEWVADFYAETMHLWPEYSPGIAPVSRNTMINLILFVLKNSTFEFKNEYYVQNYGTTMGSSFSVRFANIFMHQFLKRFFSNFPHLQPNYIARLIDDIFFTWDKTRDDFQTLINSLNSWHQTIKFEPTISDSEVNFLDTTVFIDKTDYTLHTKLFRKPTYRVQYLQYRSNHPQHVMKAIPYSQALRYKRIIDDNETLNIELNTLRNYFLARGYPHDLLDSEISKVHKIDRNKAITYKTKEEKQANFQEFTKGGAFLPLILTFDPRSAKELKRSLITEWQKLLENNSDLEKVFKNSKPQVVYKRGTTIANYLIRAKFISNNYENKTLEESDRFFVQMLAELITENPNITTKCDKLFCLCCKTIETGNSFSSSVTKEDFGINDPMTCDSKDVIYLISCSKCQKQYVGQTERRLKDRLNAHRSNIKNKTQTAIAIHFNEAAHSFNNLRIIPIEIVNNPLERIRREKFWIKTLKTKYPNGLNNYPIDYSINSINSDSD